MRPAVFRDRAHWHPMHKCQNGEPLGRYSYRSASTGSTRLARRTGT
jgi:hypothetical protein